MVSIVEVDVKIDSGTVVQVVIDKDGNLESVFHNYSDVTGLYDSKWLFDLEERACRNADEQSKDEKS